ncbi:alpha/beta fold hydrolase [Phytoactinopolyspora limicola]|uniref:alpha/beta fold hydrolase n=1 Tax=Phytoactinopolyspora limicola TaxID=2715536 RepID=UPI00140DF337|nr:alpha/beta hydrolase [Phytoactinopolyspora limicola]
MSEFTIPEFTYDRIQGPDGVALNVAHAGIGPAVVLLHGFPETHLMWNAVARDLARDYTVIAPDLRGYGESDKPDADGPDLYSKRTMAADVVAVASQLGHDRFAVIGHDRGALVAVRAGLDHPDQVSHIGILDVLPTLDTWDVLRGVDAKVAWHLYLMAQPKGLPEQMIEAVAEEFFASFLDAWDPTGTTFSPELRDHYIKASAAAVPSIVADYRATASIDLDMDRTDRDAGRTLTMPVAAISQDWGSQLGFDPTQIWSAWAPDFTYEPINAGHFMAEERPDAIALLARKLLAR